MEQTLQMVYLFRFCLCPAVTKKGFHQRSRVRVTEHQAKRQAKASFLIIFAVVYVFCFVRDRVLLYSLSW